jgi:phosphoglucomutase
VRTLSNQRFYHWKNFKDLDKELRKELDQMSETDIAEAFTGQVEFGTAGMRGLLGVGPNRLNIYTIRKATLGFAKYLLDIKGDADVVRVAIAYDNRYMSKEFAYEAAQVLAMFDIDTYVYSSLRSTPQLSFTVRELKCLGGIMITASHNPKEYNGYKVYDATGCQIVPEGVEHIIRYINEIEDELNIEVKLTNRQKLRINLVDNDVDAAYKNRVLDIQLRPEVEKNLLYVFSPQHGAGFPVVADVLHGAHYDVLLVEAQCTPDPAFSNTKSPNPEEEEAYEMAIELAKVHDADVIISTDPDADRVGVVIKHAGDYQLLNGNQTGAVLLEYLFSTLKEKDMMPPNPVMFNTIVTSDLGEKVAFHYGVDVEKTLTGFKFIGEKIERYSITQEKTFVFGYEESYGYLVEAFVRDKDAVQASLLIAEAAAYYDSQNKTLLDVLHDLYQRHGTYLDTQTSLTLEGIEGTEQIAKIMEHFRQSPLAHVGDQRVIASEDYLLQERMINGNKEPLFGFDVANVIKLFLEDGSWVAIRPSGTEPKCKFYYCVVGNDMQAAQQKFNDFDQFIQNEIKKV